MIIGIGIDFCDVRRMESMLQRERFLQKYFTRDEQAYILGKKAFAAQSLAGHFAAKEAAFKALQCGIAHPLTEIEITHDARGAPFCRLTGGTAERMKRMGGETMHLTVTHTEGTAAAVAIVECLSNIKGNDACGIPVHPVKKTYQEEKESHLRRIIAGRFPYAVLTDEEVSKILPERPFDAYKTSCGHALIVAGSFGMAGAASLCVGAALRGGAGLVTAACPKDVIPIVQTLAPCAMCVPIEELRQALPTKNAVAAGPGLGGSGAVDQALQALFEAPVPQVWDADALNWLSRRPKKLSSAFVLTPHNGEAARLLDVPIHKITEDPAEAAFQLQARYGAVILLKGPVTLIADGENLTANLSGTPGMATGGSGDVLTGLIVAFLSQGVLPYDAARAAAFLHGKAGETAAARSGVRSMTAQDILSALRIE